MPSHHGHGRSPGCGCSSKGGNCCKCKKPCPPTPVSRSCFCPPGPRGERGERGERGFPGSNAIGSGGPSFKFSGLLGLTLAVGPVEVFNGLADTGPLIGVGGIVVAPLLGLLTSYPMSEAVDLTALDVRAGFSQAVIPVTGIIPLPGILGPIAGLPAIALPVGLTVQVSVLKNGSPTGLAANFTSAGPLLNPGVVESDGFAHFERGDLLDVIVGVTGDSLLTLGLILNVAATVS